MDKSTQRYNSTKAITQYYRMQYAPFISEQVPALTEQFYTEIKEILTNLPEIQYACEVGCGLGRVIFDLAKNKKGLESLIGTDISQAFIDECKKIQENNSPVSSKFIVEGTANIDFQVMDAQQMTFNNSNFDLVICLNVIDRVPEPQNVLNELYRITKQSGYLLITDPYDWNEGYTAKEKQIDNIKDVYRPDEWEFVIDKDVDFEIYSNPRKSIKYRNHLLLLRKK